MMQSNSDTTLSAIRTYTLIIDGKLDADFTTAFRPPETKPELDGRTLRLTNLRGVTLGVMAITCSGLGYPATRAPKFSAPELAFEKDNAMKRRILITYATRASITSEIATGLDETLTKTIIMSIRRKK